MWHFEADAPKDEQGHTIVDAEQDAMGYVMTFGKHKGKTLADLMRTESGRSYLNWLSIQPCTDLQFEDSYKKRCSRIAICFRIYNDWVQSWKNE